MPKAVQMQLQMPFLRSTDSSRSFLGPIKIEVLVKIPIQLSKVFLLTFLMMIIITHYVKSPVLAPKVEFW